MRETYWIFFYIGKDGNPYYIKDAINTTIREKIEMAGVDTTFENSGLVWQTKDLETGEIRVLESEDL